MVERADEWLHFTGQVIMGRGSSALTLRALTNSVSRFNGSSACRLRTR